MADELRTLPRLYVGGPLSVDAAIVPDRDQIHYLLNVLRRTEGDRLLVFNGRDGEWLVRVQCPSRKTAVLVPERQTRPQPAPTALTYAFAPLKAGRLDYMVQKAVEMGASQLVPVLTRRTQVHKLGAERLQANAIEAAEQCGILSLPTIAAPIALDRFLEIWPRDNLLIICDEEAPVQNPIEALAAHRGAASVGVVIGPEGGFADEERALFARLPHHVILSLGPRILRADTAAVAALALIQGVLGDWR